MTRIFLLLIFCYAFGLPVDTISDQCVSSQQTLTDEFFQFRISGCPEEMLDMICLSQQIELFSADTEDNDQTGEDSDGHEYESSEVDWADNISEHFWMMYSILSIVAILGLIYEQLNDCLKEAIDTDHEEEEPTEENVYKTVHKNFQNEVTILGFLAFTTFVLEKAGLWDLFGVAEEQLLGFNGATHEELAELVEDVHYSVFVAMCMHIAMCVIFATRVRYFHQLFGDTDENGIPKDPFAAKMTTFLKNWLNEHHAEDEAIVKDPNPVEYIRLKMLVDLEKLLEFSWKTWLAISLIYASLAILAFAGGLAQGFELLVSIIYYTSVAVSIVIVVYFDMKVRGISSGSVKPSPTISRAGPENSALVILQTMQFYMCFHCAHLLVSWSIFESSHFILDVVLFVLYFFIFPFLLSKGFFLVLSLPPYFDQEDVALLRVASMDEGVERKQEYRRNTVHLQADSSNMFTYAAQSILGSGETPVTEEVETKEKKEVETKEDKGNDADVKYIELREKEEEEEGMNTEEGKEKNRESGDAQV